MIDERSPPDRSGRAAERPEGLSVTHSGKSRPTGMHWPSTAAARSCPLQALHYRAQLTVLVTSASAARASEAKVDHLIGGSHSRSARADTGKIAIAKDTNKPSHQYLAMRKLFRPLSLPPCS